MGIFSRNFEDDDDFWIGADVSSNASSSFTINSQPPQSTFATMNSDNTTLTINADYILGDNKSDIKITGEQWQLSDFDDKIKILEDLGILSSGDVMEYKLKLLGNIDE